MDTFAKSKLEKLKKSLLTLATTAAVMAPSGAQATNPQYTNSNSPQGKTKTVNASAQEVTLTAEDVCAILGSTKIYQDLKKSNPKLSQQMFDIYAGSILEKGVQNIDGTITINSPTLQNILLNDVGLTKEEIVPAMKHFKEISANQNMHQAQMTSPTVVGENGISGCVEVNGQLIEYFIDRDGGCRAEGKISENIDYLLPKGVQAGSLEMDEMRAKLKAVKLQHYVYEQVKDNQSPYIQKFCKNHQQCLDDSGLEIKQGKLHQKNPKYDETTIMNIQRNNALRSK